jgi:hypothetical protein
VTFEEFKTRLLGEYTSQGAEFRVRELLEDDYDVSAQQIGAWLRKLAADGEVRYLGNETVYKGGGGHRMDYYPAEPYWEIVNGHE